MYTLISSVLMSKYQLHFLQMPLRPKAFTLENFLVFSLFQILSLSIQIPLEWYSILIQQKMNKQTTFNKSDLFLRKAHTTSIYSTYLCQGNKYINQSIRNQQPPVTLKLHLIPRQSRWLKHRHKERLDSRSSRRYNMISKRNRTTKHCLTAHFAIPTSLLKCHTIGIKGRNILNQEII
jgi:hypothetical protein